MTTRFYRSTDEGAPVLSPQPGSFNALLRACLVDGYAAKQPAGWALSYDNESGINIFQPSEGNRHYLLVNDTTTTTAALTGTEGVDADGNATAPFGTYYIGKHVTAAAQSANWVIVADETAALIFTESAPVTAPGAYGAAFFGTLIGGGSTDTFNTLITGSTAASTSGALKTTPGDAVATGAIGFSANACGVLARATGDSPSGGTPAFSSGAGGMTRQSGSTAWASPLANGDISLTALYAFEGSAAGTGRGRIPFLWAIRNGLVVNLFPGFTDVGLGRILIRQGTTLTDAATSGAVIVETQ
ncbi:hypothetical protein AGMMS49545_22570 [Betaproteobacteria bacterium]|nr:hypothetical protein AGMMS49545_22570 [Betaproteobacteria bacterium]GHU47411.1 hypothetical protein AGMMS50289_22570 [Betaproteobacteria bacterium]